VCGVASGNKLTHEYDESHAQLPLIQGLNISPPTCRKTRQLFIYVRILSMVYLMTLTVPQST
jgi:hypothetical protein